MTKKTPARELELDSRALFSSEPDQPSSATYIFLGFDVKNSTKLKSSKKNWFSIIHAFYRDIVIRMGEKYPEIEIWKYLGDEIVLCCALPNRERLINLVPEVFDKKCELVATLRSEFHLDPDFDVKTRIWIATVRRLTTDDLVEAQKSSGDADLLDGEQDIEITLDLSFGGKEHRIKDVIGYETDIGFRIGAFTTTSTVTVSADYAYLVYKLGTPVGVKDKYKIVSLQELKGVWRGRLYPIVWYSPNWGDSDFGFPYDEHVTNPIIKELQLSRGWSIGKLETIYDQLMYKEAKDKLCETWLHEIDHADDDEINLNEDWLRGED